MFTSLERLFVLVAVTAFPTFAGERSTMPETFIAPSSGE